LFIVKEEKMNKNLLGISLIAILSVLCFFYVYADNDKIEKFTVKTEDGKQLQINANGTFAEPTIKEKTMARTDKNEKVLLFPDGTWRYFLEIQIEDAGNLKMLSLLLQEYANANNGKLPDDLGVLLDWSVERNEQEIPKLFICPTSMTKPPKNGDEVRNGQCDYVYLGKGKFLKDLKEDEPLIITNPEKLFHRVENVCYGDTHVTSIYPISENTKKLLKKLLEK